MIYRVHLGSQDGAQNGYLYFTSQRESQKVAKEWDRKQAATYDVSLGSSFDENGDRKVGPFELSLESEISAEPTPTTQREWMDLLTRWGGHPDNG